MAKSIVSVEALIARLCSCSVKARSRRDAMTIRWWLRFSARRKVLHWRDGDGARGELMRTIRVPY